MPPGASVQGGPAGLTSANSATFNIRGPGYWTPNLPFATNLFHFRLNGGIWSGDLPVATPIVLSNLTNGAYTLGVAARNDAAVWQPTNSPTIRSWTVNTQLLPVRLNEIFAAGGPNAAGGATDWIELYNSSAQPVDLSEIRLTDHLSNSNAFVFPAGTSLTPFGFLQLFADDNAAAGGFITDSV